jgi:hypothetical protein
MPVRLLILGQFFKKTPAFHVVTYTVVRLTIARNIWILSCIKEHKVLTRPFSYFMDNSNVYGGLWLKIFLSIVLDNSSACNPIYLLSEIRRSEYHPYICWVRLSEYRPYIWRATLIAAGLESVSACQVENFRPINACTTMKSNSLILWKLPLFWTLWVLWGRGVLSFDPKWLWFQTSWKYFSPHT